MARRGSRVTSMTAAREHSPNLTPSQERRERARARLTLAVPRRLLIARCQAITV
jgi:hypothetical protein